MQSHEYIREKKKSFLSLNYLVSKNSRPFYYSGSLHENGKDFDRKGIDKEGKEK